MPSVAPAAASPSPTAGADVGPLLAEQFSKVTSGGSTMAGTVAIGPTQATFTGSGLFNGPDSTQRLSMTVGGVTTTQQFVTVAGRRYTQLGDGPWLPNESAPGSGDSLTAELKRAMGAGRDLDAGA